MSEKLELLHTDRVLIVEGKYDAARLSHLTDAMILLTDGFGIYKDKKRQQLFKQLAHKNGLILLTDSDAAGFRIRTYITNLGEERGASLRSGHPRQGKAEGSARQRGASGGRGRGRCPRFAGAPGRSGRRSWHCPCKAGGAANYLYRPL